MTLPILTAHFSCPLPFLQSQKVVTLPLFPTPPSPLLISDKSLKKIPRYLEIPILYRFVKLGRAEDIYPKNTKRKAFQKKRPNRDEIRFRTKTIVTSLPRTFNPIGQKIIS